MKKFITDLISFLKNTAADPRIPDRDKTVLLALIALVISPIDLIPDWIPIIGVLDDFFIISLVLNYFFETLDQKIILSHYPWGMKSYLRLKRFANMTSFLIPNWVKKSIWKYVPDPY
jgi:uncharacterized membrane protein YkvA (DUF1232 family)